MATKDEWYDPKVNYDLSDDEELNNEKFSPGTSPSDHDLGDIFVFNDLRQRRGPQADNAASAISKSKDKECTNQNRRKCRNRGLTDQLYDGNRYSCSLNQRTGFDLAEYTAKHRFCWECADLPTCPSEYCSGAAKRLDMGYQGHEKPNPIND